MGGVVVVGASLAGLRVVEGLRRRGYEGALTLVGEESHPPYDRPPLSKQVLSGAWEPERTRFRQKDGYEPLQLDLRLGTRAEGLDTDAREVRLEGGDMLCYGKLVIATGAAARWLPGTEGKPGVHVLRTLDDALGLKAALVAGARVVVVGAGFIGLEVASSCRALGLSVQVVDPLPLPLSPVLGNELAEAVCAMHRAEGVELIAGVGVAGIDDAGGERIVHLADGRALPADVVVVGIGVRPATGWLAGSGVQLFADGAVLCGSDCQTNVPGVYGVGDVARFRHATLKRDMRIEHWTHAVEMAQAVVAHMLDPKGAPPFAPVPYVWSDQYDVKLQFAGVIDALKDDFEIVAGDVASRKLVGIYHHAGRLTGVVAWSTPVGLIKGRKLLAEGASVDGARAALGG